MAFHQVDIAGVHENFIRDIGTEWMLVTAGDRNGYNMMTASWGFTGVMWGFPCAIAAIRPQRYTKKFMEEQRYFTLSFYGKDKAVHTVCGKQSGRDIDKTAATGLTPVFDAVTGAPYFKQARLVLVCEKLYVQDMTRDAFISNDIPDTIYKGGDYHRLFYGKIVTALENDEQQ